MCVEAQTHTQVDVPVMSTKNFEEKKKKKNNLVDGQGT